MVISWRSTGGIVAIWLAAVVGVSATASVAIDRAGRDITSVTVTSMPPAAPILDPTAAPQPSTTTTAPAAAPKPSATQKPSATPTSPTPGATRTRRSAPPHRTPWRAAPSAPATPIPTSTPTPTPRERTTRVTGGVVSARCTGEKIALRFAQPDFDWRVHVNTYDGRIYVSFLTGDEESQRKTQVTAVCRNGTPNFTVTRG